MPDSSDEGSAAPPRARRRQATTETETGWERRITGRPTAAVAPSGPVWRASRRGIVSCSPEPFGGGVGGALKLLEPSQVRRAAAVEPRSIEVDALAVVVRLLAKLV